MATTRTADVTPDFADSCREFMAVEYRDEIGQLAQHYPQEQRSLIVDYDDLWRYEANLADDLLDHPDRVLEVFESELDAVDIPLPTEFDRAHVRVVGLPETHTFYPGEFSPADERGTLRAIRGEVIKTTKVYSRLQVAAFECQRCGTLTRIPQSDGSYQEPHECQGCERQGPFETDFDQSELVDAQKIRVQMPPELAAGDGEDIDVFVEDDMTDVATVGDRVTVTGIVRLEQESKGSEDLNKFDAYVDGVAIDVEETDAREVSIEPEEREEIEAMARGDRGDPLELAAESLAPKIYGYDQVKRAIVLALVGGARANYEGEDFDRGEFHVLLIGDPSTGKSKLVDRAEQVGWRSVGVSGKGATVAGVTATAVQDDFGDGSWTLDAGAAVKAHRGVLAVDELDDMPDEVRSALLEPMSKQKIHITKGGVNTHLNTRVAVVAAANPKHGRFDPFEPIASQFDFSSALLSRFDLVFTFRDQPDEEEDATVGGHVLDSRDSAKRENRGEDIEDATHRGPISPDLIRKWVALAKQQPKPVFADESVRDQMLDQFTSLRGLYGYDDPDDPIPVTLRKLEGIVRLAEAAAKFEFSETIEQRHAEIATELVGASMQDIGKDPESGEYDADIVETGASQSQRSRKKAVVGAIKSRQRDGDGLNADVDDVIDDLADEFDRATIEHDIEKLMSEGVAIEPRTGSVRYVGGR